LVNDRGLIVSVQLVADICQWQNANFGTGHPRLALLGLLEESGELCHAVLKCTQGIRGTVAEHKAAMADAVGDIVIYLVDFVRRGKLGDLFIQFEAYPFDVHSRVGDEPLLLLQQRAVAVCAAIGKLSDIFAPYFFFTYVPFGDVTHGLRVQCQAILVALSAFCSAAQIHFGNTVDLVWDDIVRKRDWRQYPLNGVSA
jgi:NTP pyrophosphatase (non-canonical NTP hydrolase)